MESKQKLKNKHIKEDVVVFCLCYAIIEVCGAEDDQDENNRFVTTTITPENVIGLRNNSSA